ncbi:cytochrome P450 2B4-like [Babylonia areolata]|uniref:cytochrome P450 2B4-like n=1 Tax=Babylonia areolata TaxID=304850 RepID=UPI003FCF2721
MTTVKGLGREPTSWLCWSNHWPGLVISSAESSSGSRHSSAWSVVHKQSRSLQDRFGAFDLEDGGLERETLTTVQNGQANTICRETLTTVQNGQANTICRETLTTVQNGQANTICTETLTTVQNGQANTICTETLTTVQNGQANTICREALTTVQNGQANTICIILSHGPTWKEQRKASLEILRKLGMGKNLLASKVQEEVSHYIRAVEDHQGQPADLHRLTTVSVSNNICSIVFGRRFRYDDPVFIRYIENVEDNIERLGSAAVIHFIPFLEYLPGDLFGIRQIMANVKAIEETFFQPLIDEHVRPSTMTGGGDDDDSGNDKDELNGDSDGDDDEHQQGPARDFIYGYLQQMRRKEKQGVFTSLCEPELLTTVGDLFIAGTETTSVTLRWTLLYFLHHQHVQDKCFQEVREVIGLHRPPTIRDRPRMVYLEATLNEVLRVSSIAPFAVGHSTPCDVSFRGYVIPRGAVIMPFLDTALHDPEVWGGDPYSFRPERFIDADGKLVRPEEFIPFGVGRRMCLGEALARVELFLYLSTLVQHFRFLPPEPEALPSLVGHLGGTHVPEPYKIRAVRRRE